MKQEKKMTGPIEGVIQQKTSKLSKITYELRITAVNIEYIIISNVL